MKFKDVLKVIPPACAMGSPMTMVRGETERAAAVIAVGIAALRKCSAETPYEHVLQIDISNHPLSYEERGSVEWAFRRAGYHADLTATENPDYRSTLVLTWR